MDALMNELPMSKPRRYIGWWYRFMFLSFFLLFHGKKIAKNEVVIMV